MTVHTVRRQIRGKRTIDHNIATVRRVLLATLLLIAHPPLTGKKASMRGTAVMDSTRAMCTVFRQRAAGFTMIEILVVLTILGILLAVALPSYGAYVIKANRNAAQAFLFEVASRQERQLMDSRGYAATITAMTSAGLVIPPSVAANYTITTTSPRAGISLPSYDVTAVPTGTQLAKDTKCGTLSIYEDGTKVSSGTGTTSSCWEQ